MTVPFRIAIGRRAIMFIAQKLNAFIFFANNERNK